MDPLLKTVSEYLSERGAECLNSIASHPLRNNDVYPTLVLPELIRQASGDSWTVCLGGSLSVSESFEDIDLIYPVHLREDACRALSRSAPYHLDGLTGPIVLTRDGDVLRNARAASCDVYVRPVRTRPLN